MNRLKELRQKSGLTLKELSDVLKKNDINISSDSLAKYERGDRKPKYNKWLGIAKFYGVTVPYLQGTTDKPKSGYSKEYIYKLLDDMYKDDWMNPVVFKEGLADKILQLNHQIMDYSKSSVAGFFSKSTIQIYCENNNIKMPCGLSHNFGKYDLPFWKENFNFIFQDNNVNRLLTTKDTYTDDEIKELILSAIAERNTGYTLKQAIKKLKTE